jgi:hypothetical protein
MGAASDDLFGRRVRLNPRLRVVSFDQLGGEVRESIGSIAEQSEFFGLLLAHSDATINAKSLSRDAALLLYAAQQPTLIAHLARSMFGAHATQRTMQLIADGILEIESEDGFVSGAAAVRPASLPQAEQVKASRLSHSAIEYGAMLPTLSSREIARRLYMFNRLPNTPTLQLALSSPEQTLTYVTRASSVTRHLTDNWIYDSKSLHWLSFRLPGDRCPPTYKLYISPSIEALPDAFPVVVGALVRTRCESFKIGSTAAGLLRPDKMVAYFDRLELLLQAADLIQTGLTGIAVHGVPFAAVIDPSGLLSWGMDPPAKQTSVRDRSWREWLVSRVADHILTARNAGSPIKEFVLERLKLDGIDNQSWSPNLSIWISADS